VNIESPLNPFAKQEVDQSHQAARVSLRSYDWKGVAGTHQGGHYRMMVSTGLCTGIAAGGALFSARWTNADRTLVLNRIRAWATVSTVFGTAQEVSVDLARVVNYTAADTAGTAIDLGEFCRKDRQSMRATQIASMRVAGAVALTAGTATEETPMTGSSFVGLLNAVGSMAQATLYENAQGHEDPIHINNLEGFRLRNRVAMGAGGVITFTFEIDWMEIPTAGAGQ
jgi:hypothetical protein